MITRIMCALVLIAGILGVTGVAHADQVKTFMWSPPTQYTDGAPLPGSAIAKYTITCTGGGGVSFDAVASATLATRTFTAGTYSCTIAAILTPAAGGASSGPSNAVGFTVPVPSVIPKTIVDFSVT